MREDGQVLMYPQALLRQSILSPDFELQPIDMIINFNLNQIWYFGNPQENIRESAVDFECNP